MIIKNKKNLCIGFICLLILSSMLVSCKKNEPEQIVEETTMTETEETEIELESIDVSDIEDTKTKSTLLRINALNDKLGKLIYVSKDDFLKYRDVNVSLMGDSISANSTASLKKYFNNLQQDSLAGRELAKGIEVFDRMKEKGQIGDVFVFSLGTNASDGMLMDVFEHVYEGLEGKPMIVVNTYFPYRGQVRNRNREIKKFKDTHENVFLADWYSCVNDNKEEFIVEDGTHPSATGGEVYAQLVFKTVVEAMKAQGK